MTDKMTNMKQNLIPANFEGNVTFNDNTNRLKHFKSRYYSQTFEAPSSMEEFLQQGWEAKIRARIRRFKLYDTLKTEDDMFQSIILSLMTTNYLSRYDGSSPFESFIIIFVDNYLKRAWRRENVTKHGKKIVTRASLEINTPSEENSYEPGVIYLETLMGAVNTSDEVDFVIALQQLRKDLDSKFPANSYVIHDGKRYDRKPGVVLDLLAAGNSVVEIADILECSKQFIYSLLKKVRSLTPDYFTLTDKQLQKTK